ncbi:MAG: universal stress protein [Terriglobia bacterium]|jgi:nucleotide-binding universal stress UspA family protein
MSNFAPKHILCPVDFSDQSAAALRVAGVIAQSFGSEVAVLHVQRLEAPVYFTVAQTQALQGQLRRSVRAARKLVSEFVHKHLPETVGHRVMVMEDDPVAAILKTQQEIGADLIAMGTHGRGGLARVRLGSIAESVLHQAEVPILTVSPRMKLTPTLDAIRRVLCPVNYSPSSQTALEHAAAVASSTGAELIVAHIDEAPLGKSGQDSLGWLSEWIPATVRAHCAVKEVVKQGSAAEQIVEEAERSHADLLVIGAQPRSLLGAVLLGSTTELVIRSAACPVLSVTGKKYGSLNFPS